MASRPLNLATSSVEEGLDFACNLLVPALSAQGDAHPSEAQSLLSSLGYYISFRYSGELGLALEKLASLGHSCNQVDPRGQQFWAQLRWVAAQMNLTPDEQEALALPERPNTSTS